MQQTERVFEKFANFRSKFEKISGDGVSDFKKHDREVRTYAEVEILRVLTIF